LIFLISEAKMSKDSRILKLNEPTGSINEPTTENREYQNI
jgi:hypothetical protein